MAIAHFLSLNQHKALARPILFFNLDSELKDYISLDRDELHNRLKSKLSDFRGEVLNVELV
jgi:hypothetical protein